MSDEKCECGWVKLYHRSGALVTIPVTEKPANYAAMLANVDAMVEAGFTALAPGLEAGEEKEQVAYVVHSEHERDGQVTPVVLLYSANDAMKWSFLKIYLNRPEDVEAFEFASKMKLANIPIYVGQDKPQRGASRQIDRFIVPAPQNFGVVFKANPKHDPSTEEGKMKPARLFIRWVDQKPAEQNKAAPLTADVEAIRAKWKHFLASDAPVDVFNRFLDVNYDEVPEGMRKNLDAAITEHAGKAGWGWDEQTGLYFTTAGKAKAR